MEEVKGDRAFRHRDWRRRLRRWVPMARLSLLFLVLRPIPFLLPWLALLAAWAPDPRWEPVADGIVRLWLLVAVVRVLGMKLRPAGRASGSAPPLLHAAALGAVAAVLLMGRIDYALAVHVLSAAGLGAWRLREGPKHRIVWWMAWHALALNAILSGWPGLVLLAVAARPVLGMVLSPSTVEFLRRLPSREECLRRIAEKVERIPPSFRAELPEARLQCLCGAGLWPEAEVELDRLRDVEGVGRRKLARWEARILVETHRYSEAVALGEWLTQWGDELGEAAPAVALAHVLSGAPRAGLLLAHPAVRKRQPEALLMLGRIHAARGHHDRALRCYEAGLQRWAEAGHAGELQAHAAAALEALGDPQEAAWSWTLAVRQCEWRNPESLQAYARCLRAAGRCQEADEVERLVRG